MPAPPTPRRILVPLDGSDTAMDALPWVRALATGTTELVLLHVVTSTMPSMPMAGVSAELYESALRAEREAAAAFLADIAAGLASGAAEITTLAQRGFPADEILEAARSHEVDLILMVTQGRGATGRLVVGSVADRVARSAPVPVMLVHASEPEPASETAEPAERGRLVVLLDGSDRARAALPVAADLARRLGAPVRLLRVVPTRDAMFTGRDARQTGRLYQRLLRAFPTLPQTEVDDAYYEEYTGSIATALASEASRLAANGVAATSELRIGPTMPSIIEALSDGDVVVMTSHGESGVRRWMLGSVAEKLIHQAVAPVVLVPLPERQDAAVKRA